MDRGLPSNILIPRISVSSSPDLWIFAAGKSHVLSLLKVLKPDRETVVWTKMSFLNAVDIYAVCFKKGLKFNFLVLTLSAFQ